MVWKGDLMYQKSRSYAVLAPVTTMLKPSERLRVDAAAEGFYQALHRDSVAEVVRDLKERHAGAVIVSVARCGLEGTVGVATVVREFPRVPAVAILSDFDPRSMHAVLTLGRSGVRTLIDVRHPDGWRALRQALLEGHAADMERHALSQLAIDLAGAPVDCWRFFEALFQASTRVSTVRQLARSLHVLPTTLMSRFFRLKLPTPKQYLAFARLVRAARLFENPGLSVANVSNALDYSSPQSFSRHVRGTLAMTAVDFRERYDGEGMFHRFREELVLPHAEVLRRFNPLTAPIATDARAELSYATGEVTTAV
jgi:AraC-like DNA-binding protein